MSDSDGAWRTGLGLAGAIVGAVAGLLLAIIAVARSIEANVGRALRAAEAIVTNTNAIWELDKTNKAAAELLATARAIERHATDVADGLERPR
ncbi:MAG TPA: hypothetical protein PKD53_03860 [Chloroflexaceae bacterium]|nr:hypothetical protein [Chloroflexaceae bacterium]